MDVPAPLQKEFMGIQWWKFFAIVFIADRLWPHWALKGLAGIAFIIGFIYIVSSIKRTEVCYYTGDHNFTDRNKDQEGEKDKKEDKDDVQ